MNKITAFAILVVCQVAVILAPFRLAWTIITSNQDQMIQIFEAYDRLGNAVTNGNSAQTISTRANQARIQGKGWGCILCKILDKIQANHCENARA